MSNNVYDPSKEWEYFDFPIEISNLQFEKNLHDLTSSCVVKIWRDEEFKLTASISGHTLTPLSLNGENEEGLGNFAILDTITGFETSNNSFFTLTECVVGSFSTEGVFYPERGYPFIADLHITSFTKKPVSQPEPGNTSAIQYDWFICASASFLYPEITRRFFKDKLYKNRDGVDTDYDIDHVKPSSFSRDFFTIDIPGVKCIVASVPKQFRLSWAKCMCIEYRLSFGMIPDSVTKNSIQNFIGFLIGTELLKIGTTKLSEDVIIHQEAFSPSGNNVLYKCQNGIKPPIQFNNKYDWGKIDKLINSLLPVYLRNCTKLSLNSILWRYFQAKELAVGINLPVISSAIEILATNYLKSHKEITHSYLSEEEYLSLAGEEIQKMKEKLSHISGHDKMMNKIKTAFNRGANEKLELFFQSIDLPLSKIERDAMKARNSMAHGGSEVKTMEEAKKLILKTRAYETLFHRVFLRILGYDQYYIDYYLPKNVSKKITNPTGPKEV